MYNHSLQCMWHVRLPGQQKLREIYAKHTKCLIKRSVCMNYELKSERLTSTPHQFDAIEVSCRCAGIYSLALVFCCLDWFFLAYWQ